MISALFRVGCLAFLCLAAAGCGPAAPRRPPNIVLVMVDTLRADYLGFHGFEGPVSPHLDRLAAESLVYDHCFTQAPWTKPAVASLFTSLYPDVHRLTNHEGRYWGGDSPASQTGVLAAEAVTLAEVLLDAGYATAGFVSNPWVTGAYGFAQGFEHYDESGSRDWVHADVLIDAARIWIAQLPDDQPFFVYLHFMDVHAPYQAPREDFDALLASSSLGRDGPLNDSQVPYARWQAIERRPKWATDEQRHTLRYWKARYASGVRAFDRRLEVLTEFLRKRELLDQSIYVVTSDHGEELFEHGDWSHGQNLFDHQLHVPLVVRLPGGERAGERDGTLVELVDVMPTLLTFAGLTVPPQAQGRDRSRPGDNANTQACFASATQRRPGLHAVRTRSYKLLQERDHAGRWLFDLEDDPQEQRDVAASRPEPVAELSNLLGIHLVESTSDGTLDPQQVEIPEDVKKRLEALGYVD